MEVINLATDAILKVKDAELKAKEILEKAHKDALILKEEAKEKVKNSYDEAIKNAKKEAENLGATYIVAGHIFKTDCKKDLEPRGLEFIQELSSVLIIPIFAIGGINQENSHLVINNGAFGVCMMSSLMKH